MVLHFAVALSAICQEKTARAASSVPISGRSFAEPIGQFEGTLLKPRWICIRCAQVAAPSGDPLTYPATSAEPLTFQPFGSYVPRGTMTSQHPLGSPSDLISPQPSPGASTDVST